jgi:hypothetical protein
MRTALLIGARADACYARALFFKATRLRNAIGYAMHYSRSHNAVIRVYDAAGNVIETH